MLSELIDRILGIPPRCRSGSRLTEMRGKWAHRLLFVWEHRCGYCDQPLTTANFTIDHFIPRARGGKNRLENWVPVCEKCNGSKDSKEPWVWMRERGVDLKTFGERRERWCTYVYNVMKDNGHYQKEPVPVYSDMPEQLTFR